MKRLFLLLLPALFFCTKAAAQQRRCGYDLLTEGMSPDQRSAFNAQYAAQVKAALAQAAAGTAGKTTGSAPVPVVFHYLVTDAEKVQLRGDTGIMGRVMRQIEVLNEDFNALNANQIDIPAPFKFRFGNAGIRFGLAGATSAYTIAKGIEVRTISSSGGYDFTTGFADAKRFSEGGLDSWDADKYLNVWVFNTGNQLLGLAIPKGFIGSSFSGSSHVFTKEDVGVTVHYRALGRRQSAFDSYIANNDLGRTLTHEVGHFFNLQHIWGNTNGSCSIDDGIADTPPQFEATYCSSGCPVFPLYDACSPTGNGIMFMNYMDYADDRALNMFTQNQVAVMKSLIAPGGLLVGLTDNPSLSVADAGAVKSQNLLRLFPNPATTQLFVESPAGGKITSFTLSDVTGREVFQAAQLPQNTVSLLGMARGLYFVRATVAGQLFTGKVVLQ